jgi:excisionase family DNA binding protein
MGYPAGMADEPFLTLPQVAELLHVSERTVFNMTRDGRLPARRLPGTRKYLYVRQEIMDQVLNARVDEAGLETAETAEALED